MKRQKLSRKIPSVLFILLDITGMMSLTAQPGLILFADAGKNTISEGLFLRSVFLGNYRFGNNRLETGFQTNVINGNNILLSGYNINGSRDFKFRKTLIELNAFWLWTAYSETIKQTNYGCSVSLKQKHFEAQIGTNFRTYGIRKKEIRRNPIENDAAKIHENLNLMYSISYNIRTEVSRWNTGITVTNTDYFLINQETNPYMNIHGSFRASSPVCLFSEVWYKNAGLLNMSPNYFGFAIRGGIEWNF